MFYEPSQKQWLFITDVFTPDECDQISAYSDMLETEKVPQQVKSNKNLEVIQSRGCQ